MFLTVSSKLSFDKYKIQTRDIETSKVFLNIEPTMCMDEIRNTYKLYKLVLMKSNHET